MCCAKKVWLWEARLMGKINHCRRDLHACGWHCSTTEELKVVSFAVIKSVACAAPALGRVRVWWAGGLLSVSLLFLSYVALPSVDPILALGAHSCWSNIRLAAEWQAVTNTEAIILWLRCRVLSRQQTAALTHLATCCISAVQGRFLGLTSKLKLKHPHFEWDKHVLLVHQGLSAASRCSLPGQAGFGDHRGVSIHASGLIGQGLPVICIFSCSRLERSEPLVAVGHL